MVDLSRTSATSEVEFFVIITNDFKLLAIVIKTSILDIFWALNLPLYMEFTNLLMKIVSVLIKFIGFFLLFLSIAIPNLLLS